MSSQDSKLIIILLWIYESLYGATWSRLGIVRYGLMELRIELFYGYGR